ncbi:MAG: glycosyltransferase [Deltaproteobacteria bacterium]|nr:MAG: glycosyltransferase [Deltaproteobacteria bacterium]
MRVGVIVFTHYRRDGRVRRAAEALAARGDEVRVVALHEEGHPEVEVMRGVTVERVPLRRLSLTTKQTRRRYLYEYGYFAAEAVRRLVRWHRAAPLDLVHVHNMPDALVFTSLPAKLAGVPVLLDIHDLMPDLYQNKFGSDSNALVYRALVAQCRAAAAFADGVLTVHEEARALLTRYGIPRDRIEVVLNTSDDSIFRWRGFKEPGDRFVIVYHGSISRRHGLDLAVRAVAAQRDRFPQPVHLKIVGEGDAALELEALIRELGVQDIVSLEPRFLPVEALPDFLADADLALVPYRRSPATEIMLPCKVFDYGNMGIPQIVSRLSCVSHYFDANTVRWVEAGDEAALGEAMVELARDPEARRRLVHAMRERCQVLSWPEQRRVFLRYVDQVAAGRRRRAPSALLSSLAEGARAVLGA